MFSTAIYLSCCQNAALCGNGLKLYAGNQRFFLFQQYFPLYQTDMIILAIFELPAGNALNLVESNNLFFGKELILYHTIPTFNTSKDEGLLKILWETEKMLVTSIFSFSHNVLYLPINKFLLEPHFLSSAIAFNLDQSKFFL